jgi:hypothetical protein
MLGSKLGQNTEKLRLKMGDPEPEISFSDSAGVERKGVW